MNKVNIKDIIEKLDKNKTQILLAKEEEEKAKDKDKEKDKDEQ